jgi:TfoX/Sxy family transcriptional regulator of competence genes
MAYDEQLAQRIRSLMGNKKGLSEKKMFGGLSFLINGNMSIAASGQGGLLVRIDPSKTNEVLGSSKARLMEMRGKTMPGWLRVDAKDVKSDNELKKWVQISVDYASSLPKKQ